MKLLNLKNYVLVLAITVQNTAQAQINISEMVQESTSARSDENALYFIDFWATWCVPCVHVSKYLTSLQRQVPNGFYVVSLSKQNPDVVKKFLKEKHGTDLAVAIDFNGETFEKFGVDRSLPYGVLLNANGKKLWEGHPADFQVKAIKRYLNRGGTKSVSDFFNVKKIEYAPVEEAYVPQKKIEIVEVIDDLTVRLDVIDNPEHTKVTGDMQSIVAYLLGVSNKQVKVPLQYNKNYEVLIKEEDNEKALRKLLRFVKLKLDESTVSGEVLYLNIDDMRPWDNNQIDWGPETPRFLIDDYSIQADGVSLSEVVYKLSKVTEMPVMLSEKKPDNEKRDWQIHYKFFELMQNDLQDNYGIVVEKVQKEYSVYSVR